MKKNQIINQSSVGHGDGDMNNKKWLEWLKKNINKDKITKLKLLFK